jgi:hypothetical protein
VTVPRESRLGWFVAFSQAWGQASEPERAQVVAAERAYAAGYITAPTFIARVDASFGLAIPV